MEIRLAHFAAAIFYYIYVKISKNYFVSFKSWLFRTIKNIFNDK